MNNNGLLPELDGVILLQKTAHTSVAGHTQPRPDLIYKPPPRWLSLFWKLIPRLPRRKAITGPYPVDPECSNTNLKDRHIY